ncbi:MAG: tetratricopeptide repeat protein [Firmicutes bacterium]|nr:tetratricopeptide repeat protein [Bacillota bacterium]
MAGIKKTVLLVIIMLLLFLPMETPARQRQASEKAEPVVWENDGVLWAGKAWSTRIGDLRLAYFTGSPEEIGAQMFHLVIAPEFEKMMESFALIKQQGMSGGFLERTFKNFYAQFKFIPTFKRHTPREYIRELEGFARATGDPRPGRLVNDLLMSNAWQDVSLVYGGCSFFAAWGEATSNNRMLVGRNLDYSGLGKLAELQSVYFYEPESGYRFVTVNYPSMVGIMHGMNEKGIVIAKAYSTVVPEEATVDGIPFTIMLRHALQYGGSIDEVINIIKKTPRTVGLNILVADAARREAVVLEVSAYRMTVRRADRAHANFIYGANRFLNSYLKDYQKPGWLSSAFRENRFERLMPAFLNDLTVETAVRILRDKGTEDPEAPTFLPSIQNYATIASMVFDPDRLEIWVSAPGGFLTTDQVFIGISAAEVWRTGQPPSPVGFTPATETTPEVRAWQQVMTAAGASDQRKKELLTPVVERYPKAGYALYLLGVACLRTGEFQAALGYLEQCVTHAELPDPYYLLAAHAWLGVGYDTLGLREQALQHYEAGLAVELLEDVDPVFPQICRVGLRSPLLIDEKGQIKQAHRK